MPERFESSTTSTDSATEHRISTGVAGIDEILNGGLVPGRSTLLRGPPGAGKTLFGLHYLTAGVANGETSLFVNLGEPDSYIRDDAASFGFEADSIRFLDLRPNDEAFTDVNSFDVFPPVEVDGPEFADTLTTTIDEVGPDRIFIDPITQLRYLIDDPYRFRKRLMGLLRYLEDITVVFTSQATTAAPDDDLQFLSDAVIELDHTGEYRTVSVSKFRGSDFDRGEHSVRITDEGMVAAPRLAPTTPALTARNELASSGLPKLDDLLHGGLDLGTVTMLTGPTGVGKTTTGLQFLTEAASADSHSVLYSFEEGKHTILKRAGALGIPVRSLLEEGTLAVEVIEPATRTVDEFSQQVREDVESNDVEMVMVDSIDGYRQSLRGADEVAAVDRLARYLRNNGVTAIFTNEVHQITGEFQATEEEISQFADNVVFLRHIEFQGELRKVVGVLKKRTSDFEHTLRELRISDDGMAVGQPLTTLRGILTGTPAWESSSTLTAERGTDASET